MNLYKKFLRNLFFMTIGLFLLTGIFCFLADPYEIWHFYSRQGFNFYSTKGENIERLTKPLNFIFHQKPHTIILGTSRPDLSLSPAYWEKLTGHETYNFGVTSATIYEMRRYLEHAIANDEQLKEVFFCTNFTMFLDNEKHQAKKFNPGYDEEQIGKNFPTPANLQKILFSWDAVKDSFKNISANREKNFDYPCHESDGKFSEPYLAHSYGSDGAKFLEIYFLWKKTIDFSSPIFHEENFQEFQKIISLCEENNLELHVCILPLYPLHYEFFNDCWDMYDSWKIRLTREHLVYDFTCFDDDFARRENFWDTSNMKLSVGNKILESVSSGNFEFGEILTTENVERHNEKIRRQREMWRQNHLEEIESVNKID